MSELENKFINVIQNALPKFYCEVKTRKHFDHGQYLMIVIAASNYEINNVRGQYIQDVSLMFDIEKQELTIQVFGGNGGNRIYVIPQKNKYLAMESVKIPFRIAKSELSALKALEKFCIKYFETLKANKDILMYQDKINYTELLS